MKKIACVGFHDTGASVVDDLFREFDNVAQGFSGAECKVLHDPDGISDLEYHLVTNPNRLQTDLALDRFLRYAKHNKREYEKTFGKQWAPLCEEYVDSLVKFRYKGYSGWIIEKGLYYKYALLFKKALNRIRPPKYRHPAWYNYFPNMTKFHASLNEDEFLNKTINYIEKLTSLIETNEKTEFVLIDQMVPCDVPEKYLKYVKDLKVIVVDRDPRDLFLSQIVIYKEHVLPSDPYQFCTFYKDIRKRCDYKNTDNVLFINFEDTIYSYDETVDKILNFVGISKDHHKTKYKYFNPSVSIKGTKLWERYPEHVDKIKIIEKEIPEYLHNYNKL